MKKNNGITLIALVVTIVVLIILAGVTLNLTLGQNGIFRKVEEAKRKDSEGQAKEKVELVLVDASIEKETNTNYNKDAFLNEMLEQSGITVEEDIVIFNNYSFLIDREKLEIVESLGETLIKVEKEIQSYLGANENGKYEVSVLLTIESNTELQSVVITNPDGTTFEVIAERTQVAKNITIELDETYIITATTVDGKTGTRKLTEKSVENIRTVEELVAFRDKVNTGLTYEGKTINLLKDLDLSSVCGATVGSWEPIGTFAGTFDGNYNTISNLYIDNNNLSKVGIFANNLGTLENLFIDNATINLTNPTSVNISILTANNDGTIKNVGIKSGSINVGGTNSNYIGGISGFLTGKIENCYNNANIYATNTNLVCAGGILGYTSSFKSITNCYNTGSITSTKGNCRLGGIAGVAQYYKTTGYEKGTISNCYNKGKISGTTSSSTATIRAGGIVGQNGYSTSHIAVSITNSYTTQTSHAYSYLYWNGSQIVNSSTGRVADETLKGYTTKLGDAFINDVKIKVINEETGLEEEVWSNEGYPILKWQIER